ncbi:MAG: hypothetical protein DI534_12560 [Leifsonia xyli]|nr:MAG: hypothetical protein DI534_12560 [Leifsonia xyli]
MSGLLTLLIVALAAAALTAIVSALVILHRAGRLEVRRGLAGAALVALTGTAAVLGVAALQPGPAPVRAPVVAVVTAVDAPAPAPVDVQLPTLALGE